MTDPQSPVGFIGLGNMGAPIAQRFTAWPGGLIVCDARPEATEKAVAAGAVAVSTAAEVAAGASIISITVLDDEQVRSVITGPGGILETATPGTVIAVHSTISPRTAVDLAETCEARGVDLVDAPVSGGAAGAEQARLAIMVGGERTAYEKVKPVFALASDMTIHAGPIGAGTRMKLARNLLHFISFTATTEAARLAEAAGIDLVKLGKVVRHTDAITGGAGAIMLRDTTAPVDTDDFWHSVFTHVRDLGEKDVALALDLADDLDVELPLARIALTNLGDGLGVGPGDIATTRSTA
ncbi:NAD(P)-dependent oxidoreductase [Williamsia deligens]|uniref:NAD(P)-dependent oxidoreductase n=1 Tax=Williamsia deligens TaxID=321325 RepID=A0ABW3G3N3_9NOCA|nr:NAD(P)-dependent oxidoreductase [Williamsia deligens]MCP2194644.1 3-hydroxyisobutyrate dehydrogenase [Williamsia deligens]